MSTSENDALRRALKNDSGDAAAAEALARSRARAGDPEGARALLEACERHLLTDLCRRDDTALAALRRARWQLGFDHHESSRGGEALLCASTRPVTRSRRWSLNATPGLQWSDQSLVATHRHLLVQETDRARQHTILHAIDPSGGRPLWRRAEPMRLIDALWAPAAAALLLQWYAPADTGRRPQHRLELIDVERGALRGSLTLERWCYRRPLFYLDAGLTLVSTAPPEEARVPGSSWREQHALGSVRLDPLEVHWRPLSSASPAHQLVAALAVAAPPQYYREIAAEALPSSDPRRSVLILSPQRGGARILEKHLDPGRLVPGVQAASPAQTLWRLDAASSVFTRAQTAAPLRAPAHLSSAAGEEYVITPAGERSAEKARAFIVHRWREGAPSRQVLPALYVGAYRKLTFAGGDFFFHAAPPHRPAIEVIRPTPSGGEPVFSPPIPANHGDALVPLGPRVLRVNTRILEAFS